LTLSIVWSTWIGVRKTSEQYDQTMINQDDWNVSYILGNKRKTHDMEEARRLIQITFNHLYNRFSDK